MRKKPKERSLWWIIFFIFMAGIAFIYLSGEHIQLLNTIKTSLGLA